MLESITPSWQKDSSLGSHSLEEHLGKQKPFQRTIKKEPAVEHASSKKATDREGLEEINALASTPTHEVDNKQEKSLECSQQSSVSTSVNTSVNTSLDDDCASCQIDLTDTSRTNYQVDGITQHPSLSKKQLAFKALTDSLPIMLAYLPLGITWGILWEQSGFGLFWVPLYSIFVYAGSLQFVGLAFIQEDSHYLYLLATIFPVAMRCSFYTATMSSKLPPKGWVKILCCWGMVDGAYGILVTQPRTLLRQSAYSLTLTSIIFGYWILGTLIGALLGTHIPNSFRALNFALPCLVAFMTYQQVVRLGLLWPAGISLTSALILLWSGMQSWLFLSLIASATLTLMIVTQRSKRDTHPHAGSAS